MVVMVGMVVMGGVFGGGDSIWPVVLGGPRVRACEGRRLRLFAPRLTANKSVLNTAPGLRSRITPFSHSFAGTFRCSHIPPNARALPEPPR